MSMWNWFRRPFFAEGPPPDEVPIWVPPGDTPRGGRWYAIVRDADRLFPWCYATHYFQGNQWVELEDEEKADLVEFLKRLVASLPESLWPAVLPQEPPGDRLPACCDIRLL